MRENNKRIWVEDVTDMELFAFLMHLFTHSSFLSLMLYMAFKKMQTMHCV